MPVSIIQLPIDVLAWIAAYCDDHAFRYTCKIFHRATKTRTFRLKQIEVRSLFIGRPLDNEENISYEALTVRSISLFPAWKEKHLSSDLNAATAKIADIDQQIAKRENEIIILKQRKQKHLEWKEHLKRKQDEIPFVMAKFLFRYERRTQYSNPRLPTLHRCKYLDNDAKMCILEMLQSNDHEKSTSVRIIKALIHPIDIREYDILAFSTDHGSSYICFTHSVGGYLYLRIIVGVSLPPVAEPFVRAMSITTNTQIREIYGSSFTFSGYRNSVGQEIKFTS